MKRLKTLFSPRKIALYIFLFVIAFTIPFINKSAMSDTEAIVTKMAIDIADDGNVNVACSVLTPSNEKSTINERVYIGSGYTLSDAVDAMALFLGKGIGFAQCEILGMGEKVCQQGVMPLLDYMIRTRKLRRNTLLVSFTGEAKEFIDALTKINSENSLQANKVMMHNNIYLLTSSTSIDVFYIGYFSEISMGMMPKMQLLDEKTDNTLEVMGEGGGGENTSGNSSGGDGQGKKKYLLNDGTTSIFKKGVYQFDITPKDTRRMGYFLNDKLKGSIVIKDFTDELFNNATVVLSLLDKDFEKIVTFDGDKPVYKSFVTLTVNVEEVIEVDAGEKVIRRNQEFLTPDLVNAVEEHVKAEMELGVKTCIERKTDLLEVYKNFYRFHTKKWEKYIEEKDMDNFLEGITFEYDVKVVNEY